MSYSVIKHEQINKHRNTVSHVPLSLLKTVNLLQLYHGFDQQGNKSHQKLMHCKIVAGKAINHGPDQNIKNFFS